MAVEVPIHAPRRLRGRVEHHKVNRKYRADRHILSPAVKPSFPPLLSRLGPTFAPSGSPPYFRFGVDHRETLPSSRRCRASLLLWC